MIPVLYRLSYPALKLQRVEIYQNEPSQVNSKKAGFIYRQIYRILYSRFSALTSRLTLPYNVQQQAPATPSRRKLDHEQTFHFYRHDRLRLARILAGGVDEARLLLGVHHQRIRQYVWHLCRVAN